MNVEESNKLSLEDSNQARETRISTANTDLLFKLFDNIEHKDRKQGNSHLQSHYKMHRYLNKFSLLLKDINHKSLNFSFLNKIKSKAIENTFKSLD